MSSPPQGAYVSPRTGAVWVPVVGLEIHAQLDTRSKLFCACANRFGAEPNTLVCPVCSGQPGSLPVLNASAVRLAIRAALALAGELAPWSKFDRKNYFYCDLPKGYQITQFEYPFCTAAEVSLASGKRVPFERIHLEEDAGKAIHDRGPHTLVDLNRAGVPLIEAVSAPALESAAEARELFERVRELYRWVGASDGDMDKGSMRADVNVSVRPPGGELRTKVELKNLNSLRHVEQAVQYELERQAAGWESDEPGDAPVQETRLWDPERGETRPMRTKEDESDYRYLPEPDLPPVRVSTELLEEERGALPELPHERRRRWVEELGLGEYEAGVLSTERALADWFEAAAEASGDALETSKWVQNEVLRALADPELPGARIDELQLEPLGLAELIGLVSSGRIARNAGRTVLRKMLVNGASADEVVRDEGLELVSSGAQLEEWCRAALVGQEDTMADVRAGVEKALGALIGPVMQASAGRADPAAVRALLLKLIKGEEV